jgi:hypothetical protein
MVKGYTHFVTRRETLLLLVAAETATLFLLGALGSRLSSYLDLSPAAILGIAAVCILLVSVIVVRRQEASNEPEPTARTRRWQFSTLVPRSMLGVLPLGMCLGLLVTIPSVAFFPGRLWLFSAPAPFSLQESEGETALFLGFWLQKYELVGSTVFAGIALVSAIFIGSHRAAALAAGWAVGASVAVSLLRPQENVIWYTFLGHALFAFLLGWILVRLRGRLVRLRVALQTPRD